MSSFVCPLCLTHRMFSSFPKLFKHITLYHQNESNFRITCDLHSTCGVLYRTYSAYKSHVYRKHSSIFHSTKQQQQQQNNDFLNNNQPQENMDCDAQMDSTNTDFEELGLFNEDLEPLSRENDDLFLPFDDDNKETVQSVSDIKKSFVLFILQLREEFLLPKNITNIISTYISSLLSHMEILLEKNVFDYSTGDICSCPSLHIPIQKKKIIEFDYLKQLFDNTRTSIESITKNEYQFVKHCEEYFNYTSVEEIPLSSVADDSDFGYFIPIDKTLSTMLNCNPFAVEILENVRQHQSITEADDDLMFSIRDAFHGLKIDDDYLLIQLYVDDIGLTNPLGSKRDKHKVSMIYFTLEDIPDRYRSKIDFIQLVGICESRLLKVKRFLRKKI